MKPAGSVMAAATVSARHWASGARSALRLVARRWSAPEQRTIGAVAGPLAAGATLAISLLSWAPQAQAFELYSWTVAEGFCELRSYGMDRQRAIATALEMVITRNPFMRVDFLQDSEITIRDKETLAIARIRQQAERRCPGLARRSPQEKAGTQQPAAAQQPGKASAPAGPSASPNATPTRAPQLSPAPAP